MHVVLVVEDDPDIRATLCEALEDNGYTAVPASNGAEALAYLHGANERPCLILLDLMMPVFDGFQFRAAQLQNPELANTPVILISALDDEAQIARRIGPMNELRKPIDVDALLAVVALYCERD